MTTKHYFKINKDKTDKTKTNKLQQIYKENNKMATEKYITQGNKRLITRAIDPTTNTYVGEAKEWTGLISTSISFTQETTNFGADDDIAYFSLKEPISGSGTITLQNIRPHEWAELLNLNIEEGKGVDFGLDDAVKYFSMSFDEKVTDSVGNSTTDKTIMYKVSVKGIPNIETKSSDGKTIREFPIEVDVNIWHYEDGKKAFIKILNSEKDKALFDANKDTIEMPNLDTSGASVNQPTEQPQNSKKAE